MALAVGFLGARVWVVYSLASSTVFGSQPSEAPEGRELFHIQTQLGDRTEEDANGEYVGRNVHTAWATPRVYVRAAGKTVTGYAAASGRRVWRIPLGGAVCSASHAVSARGVVVVASRVAGGDCRALTAVHTSSGERSWSRELPNSEGGWGSYENTSTVLFGDIVAVAWESGHAAFRLNDGKGLWAGASGGCKGFGYIAGERLFRVGDCGEGMDLEAVNARTGRPSWSTRLPGEPLQVRVLSGSPLVLLTQSLGGHHMTRVSDQGQVQWQRKVTKSYALSCMSLPDGPGVCPSAAVSGRTLALATEELHKDLSDLRNKVSGFDLRTGKVSWRLPAGEDRQLALLPTNDDGLLATRILPSGGAGVEVLRIAPRTGHARAQWSTPQPHGLTGYGQLNTAALGEARYEGGRLFLEGEGSDETSVFGFRAPK